MDRYQGRSIMFYFTYKTATLAYGTIIGSAIDGKHFTGDEKMLVLLIMIIIDPP